MQKSQDRRVLGHWRKSLELGGTSVILVHRRSGVQFPAGPSAPPKTVSNRMKIRQFLSYSRQKNKLLSSFLIPP